jgi:hypothetical protein
MADKKPENDEQNPWERFRVFVSKVAAVPKDEVDEQQREYERERDQERAG